MNDRGRRTAEEIKLAEYNYYLCFKIPPDAEPKAIEETINNARRNWNNKNSILRRYNELSADIENIMNKDMGYDEKTKSYSVKGARAKELEQAKKIKGNEIRNAIVRMFNGRGGIFYRDIQNIAKENGILSFKEVKDLIADLIKDGKIKYIDFLITVIDFGEYEELEENIKVFSGGDKRNIYDFIGKPDDAYKLDCKTITDLVNNKIAAYVNNAGAKGLAASDIQASVSKIFSDNKNKEQYDIYLELKKSVFDTLKEISDIGLHDISGDKYAAFIEKIKNNLNIKTEKAQEYLNAALAHYGLTVSGATGYAGNIKLIQCPYSECGKIISSEKPENIINCPYCGKPLKIHGWNCNAFIPYKEQGAVCPVCKSSLQSKKIFEGSLNDIEKLLSQQDTDILKLENTFAYLKSIVPGYEKNPGSYVYKKIAECEQKVKDKKKEEETVGKKYRYETEIIRRLIDEKKFSEAEKTALKIKRNYGNYDPSGIKDVCGKIEKELALARQLFDKAKYYSEADNEDKAVEYASEVLEICRDFDEARMLIKKYPPAAPSEIRQTAEQESYVRIEWTESKSRGQITYSLIRKTGSVPVNIYDGELLASDLTINFYQDTNIVPATNYYYGVYAERNGIQSVVAVSSQCSVLYPDVSDVRQEFDDKKISVVWDCPYNVRAIHVWKKDGPSAPSGIGDGINVETKLRTGFSDIPETELNSYLIVCEYDFGGTKKYSKGISRTLRKYSELGRIENPDVRPLDDGGFVFSCAKQKDKVKLLCSKEKLPLMPDNVYRTSEYSKIGRLCFEPEHSLNSEGNIEFSIPYGEILWVYPMIFNEQVFILSNPFLLNNITGMRNVNYTVDNGTVSIKGNVHECTKKITVKIGHDAFPVSADGPEDEYSISKKQFVDEGEISVNLKTNTLNYISIFSELEKDGVVTVSKAEKLGREPIDFREPVNVFYTLDYKVSVKRNFTVTLCFSSSEPVEIPRLSLVKGNVKPFSKDKGVFVDSSEPLILQKRIFRDEYTGKIEFEVDSCPLNTKFTVFKSDNSDEYINLKEVLSL